MNILRVILATLVIFGTGAVSGYFIGKSKAVQSEADPLRAGPGRGAGPPMERGRRSMVDRMQRDLQLSDKQRETISAIFTKSRERSRELWKEIKSPMDNEVKRVREEIKAVLTPDQAKKFEEMNKRRRESYWNRKKEKKSKPTADDQCSIDAPFTLQCVL